MWGEISNCGVKYIGNKNKKSHTPSEKICFLFVCIEK